MTDTIIGTIWVCVDCLLTHANGECGESPDREPLSLIGDGYSVTLGMLVEEHDDLCRVGYIGDSDTYECECDRREFSRSGCEGCGSNLDGERHALTLWERAA